MDKVYRKNEDGTFTEAGWMSDIDLTDGIWLVQNKPSSSSLSSLIWRVGDINRPTDVATKVAFYSIMDEVAIYISNLRDGNSKEFKEAKSQLGDWIVGEFGIGINNISAHDFSLLILNKISSYFEEVERPPTFYSALREFLNDNYEDREVINKVINYLDKSNFVLKKINK